MTSLLFSSSVFAVATSPTSANASSTFFSYQLIDLINQNGLIGGLEGGLHSTEYFTQWMADAGDVNPTVTFDMGQTVNITSAYIWQYSYDVARGVNGFDISYSLNNVDFTPLTSANLAIAGVSAAAQVVPMVVSARYIRFVVTSNHGDTLYTGLSEVAFYLGEVAVIGKPAEPVPGLSGWMIILLSLFVIMVAFRRYHFNSN